MDAFQPKHTPQTRSFLSHLWINTKLRTQQVICRYLSDRFLRCVEDVEVGRADSEINSRDPPSSYTCTLHAPGRAASVSGRVSRDRMLHIPDGHVGIRSSFPDCYYTHTFSRVCLLMWPRPLYCTLNKWHLSENQPQLPRCGSFNTIWGPFHLQSCGTTRGSWQHWRSWLPFLVIMKPFTRKSKKSDRGRMSPETGMLYNSTSRHCVLEHCSLCFALIGQEKCVFSMTDQWGSRGRKMPSDTLPLSTPDALPTVLACALEIARSWPWMEQAHNVPSLLSALGYGHRDPATGLFTWY